VAAPVVESLLTIGSAAAGFGVLLFGRAGFAVTGTARAVAVLFATGAGVHREIIGFYVLCWLSWFWHCVTIRTETVRLLLI
jgi:hypothetical protein